MKREVRSVWRVIMTLICLVLLILAGVVTAAGLWIEREFVREAPTDLFVRAAPGGTPPKFYQYRFSDRTDRVGEAEQITRGVSAAPEVSFVAYQDIPEDLIHAIVAIEDKRFFEHRGVDWYRTAAAGANYLLGFSDRFGASTITQQLVKNVTGEKEISLRRKLQEVLFARDLERELDKREILELYLNLIPLADGCHGIAAASLHYFSKEPSELTLCECATLAAITNNPSYYSPTRHPEHTVERRNVILREMAEQGYLEEDVCLTAVGEPLTLDVAPDSGNEEPVRSWYLDMAVEDVIDDLAATYGMSRAAASVKVLSGGLRIDVAMDPDLQEYVETYYRTAVETPKNAAGEAAQSALILVDAKTGDILAVAGAIGEKTANRVQNFATATRRAPGSSIKPVTVYAPALEMGKITWSSVYDDVPVDFGASGDRPWPRNAVGYYRGLTNVAHAVAHSTNTVAVRVLEEVGLRNSFWFAKEKFHLDSLIDAAGTTDCDVAALALGQLNYGLTLRELTDAYTVFADGGVWHPYRSYYRVLDSDGTVLLSRPDSGETVISEGNAAVMTKLLQGVIREGTSSSVTLQRICECAGKTGTSQNDADRWFIGYTPEVICGVWCGYEYPEPISGNNICTGIWNTVMRRVQEIRGGETVFHVPNNVVQCTFCRESGRLPGKDCALDARGDRSAVGWFVAGTEPQTVCDRHIPVEVDAEYGGVCHGNCPETNRKTVALIRVTRDFPIPITVTDAQYVWRGDPGTMPPDPDPSAAYFEAELKSSCGRSVTRFPVNRSCTQHLTREEPQTGTDVEQQAPQTKEPEQTDRIELPWEYRTAPPGRREDE